MPSPPDRVLTVGTLSRVSKVAKAKAQPCHPMAKPTEKVLVQPVARTFKPYVSQAFQPANTFACTFPRTGEILPDLAISLIPGCVASEAAIHS
jgi:hypothetical protein